MSATAIFLEIYLSLHGIPHVAQQEMMSMAACERALHTYNMGVLDKAVVMKCEERKRDE